MALTEKLAAIADAIREKTNTTEKITLAKMPEMISSITGGGGAATEYVNFYDYDGSLLHQYPLPIFEKMAALPMHPDSRTDCECVGWNYDLETIKAMKSHVNVAAIYNQKDEEVETHTPGEPVYVDGTKLYMHFGYEMSITLYFRQTVSQGVTVHWGDGESSVSSTSYGSSNLSLSHTFQAGDYTISFEVAEGCILSLGQANTNYCVVGYVGSTNSTYVPAWNTLQKAEIDLRNTALLSSAFRMCLGLKEVIIGNGRSTAIPSYCFDYCQSLERVSLSDDISTIYEYAFRCCYRLRNITIPTSVTSIGSYAFLDCRKLHDISIPGTVKTLSSYAFQNCMALKSVHLGSGVQTLGSNLFYCCYHLEEINLPNTIKTLNGSVFLQCYALKELVFPTGITSIPSSICQSCYALKTVIIPEGIKQISSNAFNAAYALRFLGIPKSLTTIYDSAFLNCYAMRNVVLGMNVKEIRAGAFQGLYGLEYIIPNADADIITTIFRLFLEGKSYRQIAAHLKNIGSTGLRGANIKPAGVQYILRNEIYVGDRLLQKRAPRNLMTKQPEKNVEYESNYLQNDHEGIIDRESWEAVQEILDRRASQAASGMGCPHRNTHPMYGKIVCAQCGSPYTRKTYQGYGDKGNYHAWICSGKRKGSKCASRGIREEALMREIQEQMGWNSDEMAIDDILKVEVGNHEVVVHRK